MRKALIALILIAAGLLFWKSIINNPTAKRPQEKTENVSRDAASEEGQRKYEELTKRITQDTVFPGVVAVHIFREEEDGHKYLHATGGQLTGDGTILTCGHAFWNLPNENKRPWKYFFQVLQPYEKKFRPINRVVVIDKVEQNNVNASRDVMACIPGEATVIIPFNPPSNEVTKDVLHFSGCNIYKSKQPVRSTVTGETVNLIGETQLVNGPGYFILDCETFPSQSGTLYASSDGTKVYIVSRSIKLYPELRKIYNLDDSYTGVTLCSSVIIR